MIKLSCALLIFISFISSPLMAEETKSKKDLNKSQAEGLSYTESLKLSEQRWHGSIGTSVSKGMNFYTEYYGSTSMMLSYKLSNKEILALSGSYRAPVDLVDADPDRFGIGFSDVELSYSRPGFYKTLSGAFSYSSDLSFPTSNYSRDSKIFLSWGNSVSYRHKLTDRFTVSSGLGLNLSHFRFKRSNSGLLVYSPLAASVSVSLNTKLTNRIFWVNAYALANTLDYDSKWDQIQTVSTAISGVITNNWMVSGYYYWRDTYESNQNVFDEDRITAGASLTYNF